MKSNITIGVVAAINWETPHFFLAGVTYVPQLENISINNPDLEILILNFESLGEDGMIESFNLRHNQFCKIHLSKLSFLHFLDFDSPLNRSETLKGKWYRVSCILDYLEKYNIKTINSIKAIRYCTEKQYLFELQAKGIPIIETLCVKSSSHIDELKKEFGNGNFVIKPKNGECALFVFELNKLNSVTYSMMREQADEFLIQPFREEVYLGEFSMLFFRDRFCHAVAKTPTQRSGLVPSALKIKAYEPGVDEIKFGTEIFAAFPHDLDIFRVDYIKVNNKFCLMEVEAADPFHYAAPNSREYAKKIGDFYRSLCE